MTLEAVHTIHEYYDGPELGVADFNGRPYVYERVNQRRDGKPQIYRLSPIAPEALSAVMEDWQLFLKWNAAQMNAHAAPLTMVREFLPRTSRATANYSRWCGQR